jgi:hypothetical protein
VATATTRLALRKPNSDPVTGDNVDVDADLNANFDKVDNAAGAFPCTSGTRPGTPWHGQIIRETDTGRTLVWNTTNSAWDNIYTARGINVVPPGGTTANLRMQLSSGAAIGNWVSDIRINADANTRFHQEYDGYMEWGSGSAIGDTNLYRAGASQLQTDDMFRANSVTLAGNGSSINAAATSSGNDDMTSATYVNMAGTGSTTVVNYTKKYSGTFTKMKVTMMGTAAAITGVGTFKFGIRTNSTDFDMGSMNINTISQHHTYAGCIFITGLAAGALTFQARWLRTAGANILRRTTDDWLSIVVEEVSV